MTAIVKCLPIHFIIIALKCVTEQFEYILSEEVGSSIDKITNKRLWLLNIMQHLHTKLIK